jgi:hypothetical protein
MEPVKTTKDLEQENRERLLNLKIAASARGALTNEEAGQLRAVVEEIRNSWR